MLIVETIPVSAAMPKLFRQTERDGKRATGQPHLPSPELFATLNLESMVMFHLPFDQSIQNVRRNCLEGQGSSPQCFLA